MRHWLAPENRLINAVLCAELATIVANAGVDDATEGLFLQLQRDFPTDAGCAAAFLLNIVILSPGECCFYDNDVPHAYLSGGVCSDLYDKFFRLRRSGLLLEQHTARRHDSEAHRR